MCKPTTAGINWPRAERLLMAFIWWAVAITLALQSGLLLAVALNEPGPHANLLMYGGAWLSFAGTFWNQALMTRWPLCISLAAS